MQDILPPKEDFPKTAPLSAEEIAELKFLSIDHLRVSIDYQDDQAVIMQSVAHKNLQLIATIEARDAEIALQNDALTVLRQGIEARDAELETAYNELNRLSANALRGLEETMRLESLEIKEGHADARIKSEVVPVIAESLTRFFEMEGGLNNVSMKAMNGDGKTFEIIVRPIEGKIPAEILAERDAEIAAERAKTAETLKTLISVRDTLDLWGAEGTLSETEGALLNRVHSVVSKCELTNRPQGAPASRAAAGELGGGVWLHPLGASLLRESGVFAQ